MPAPTRDQRAPARSKEARRAAAEAIERGQSLEMADDIAALMDAALDEIDGVQS